MGPAGTGGDPGSLAFYGNTLALPIGLGFVDDLESLAPTTSVWVE